MALEKQLRGDGRVLVRFTIPAVGAARQAAVVGEFNDWSDVATPMEDVPGGGFHAEVVVAAGRAYRFRYLLDGQRWENDWAADGYVSNEFGGDDSVLDLSDGVVGGVGGGWPDGDGAEPEVAAETGHEGRG